MTLAQTLDVVADLVVRAGAIVLFSVILTSRLTTYRVRAASGPTCRDRFFSLPRWAQIVGGIAACAAFAFLGYLLGSACHSNGASWYPC
ncbi:MAG: hypothetical protein M1389_05720 [Chloroflexi bacterium]|nr:hypothetical protein [Chloroflexota bacterium]